MTVPKPLDETEWLRSVDACQLLDHLFPTRGPDTEADFSRKLRLYLAGLGRAAWAELPPTHRALIELAEHLADRPPAAAALLARAGEIAEQLGRAFGDPAAVARCEDDLRALGFPPPDGPARPVGEDDWDRLTRLAHLAVWTRFPHYRTWVRMSDHRADLVRDVFGNPFRGLPGVERAWLTPEVVGVARRMYETRRFEAMPVLADALEDAGCADGSILEHCRREPVHVRGCWVVDLVREGR